MHCPPSQRIVPQVPSPKESLWNISEFIGITMKDTFVLEWRIAFKCPQSYLPGDVLYPKTGQQTRTIKPGKLMRQPLRSGCPTHEIVRPTLSQKLIFQLGFIQIVRSSGEGGGGRGSAKNEQSILNSFFGLGPTLRFEQLFGLFLLNSTQSHAILQRRRKPKTAMLFDVTIFAFPS